MPPGLSDPKFRNPLHAIDLVRFRERARTLTHIAAFTTVDRVLSFGGGEPAVINTAAVSAEMFRVAIDTPLLGRAFTEEEETRRAPLLVLSYGAWQRALGGDRTVIGRNVELDGDPHTIVGVMPRSFPPTFLQAEAWTPLGITKTANPAEGRTYIVTIAELADGATFEQAAAEVRAIVADLTRELPKTHQGWTGGLITFREWQYGGSRTAGGAVCAVVALLLIAWSNVASLTLAHVTASQRTGASPCDRRDWLGGRATGAARDHDHQCRRRDVVAGDRGMAGTDPPGDCTCDHAGARRGFHRLVSRYLRDGLRAGIVAGCRVDARLECVRCRTGLERVNHKIHRLARATTVAKRPVDRANRDVRGAAGVRWTVGPCDGPNVTADTGIRPVERVDRATPVAAIALCQWSRAGRRDGADLRPRCCDSRRHARRRNDEPLYARLQLSDARRD